MGLVSGSVYGPTTLHQLSALLVGRQREAELVVAALLAGRHLVLEGPPGTGKSTLLRSIAKTASQDFELVEGNAELTPARLSGHFDPALVLERGYDPGTWVDGPLARALRDGSILYLEEINRVPEETLNLLVTVMSEAELTVPRLGRIEAHPDFRLVAAMNPYDAVGTARISAAIYDRVCRIAMEYQSLDDEVAIATSQGGLGLDNPADHLGYVRRVVTLVRATRSHPEIRVGSSVRGAIDLLRLAVELGRLRSLPPTEHQVGLDAALTALTGRIRLHESATASPEAIITALWHEIMGVDDAAGDGADGADGDSNNGTGHDDETSGGGDGQGKGRSRGAAGATTTGS